MIGDCSYDLMQRAQTLGLTLADAGHFNRKSGDSGVRGADRRGVPRVARQRFRAARGLHQFV